MRWRVHYASGRYSTIMAASEDEARRVAGLLWPGDPIVTIQRVKA